MKTGLSLSPPPLALGSIALLLSTQGMLSSSHTRAPLDSLRRLARRPQLRAAAAYLVVSPATAVLGTLVGSTSEYRCAGFQPAPLARVPR